MFSAINIINNKNMAAIEKQIIKIRFSHSLIQFISTLNIMRLKFLSPHKKIGNMSIIKNNIKKAINIQKLYKHIKKHDVLIRAFFESYII